MINVLYSFERGSELEYKSSFKKGLRLRLKWVGNTTAQLSPQKRATGWRGTAFGVHLQILHFKFQFFKPT